MSFRINDSPIDENFKNRIMENNATQQEILLVTGTSFAARQACEKDGSGTSGAPSTIDRLQAACWNGLLPEMLPEIIQKTPAGKQLYLWQVYETTSFLELKFGDYEEEQEREMSIDPYSFMSTEMYN